MDTESLLHDLIEKALKKGADAADAVAATATSISHAQRLGNVEKLERSEAHDMGLRVIIGNRQAVVSSNDWKKDALEELVDQAVAMAKFVPEDPNIGLADPDQIFKGPFKELDLFDAEEPSAEMLIERAKAAEDAALGVEGITNSEGAEADWSQWDIRLVASNGFSGAYRNSRHGVGVSVLAGEGTGMESDYDFHSTVHGEDLEDPVQVGLRAARKAVEKLNPKKGATGQFPIVFDPRVANSIPRHLAGAVNGASVARGTSFLKDKLHQQVMASGITIVEDPHRVRGLASKPFDAEGLKNYRKNIVDDGTLTTWILDLRTARQLEMESTGNASRGAGSPPSPSITNLYIDAGAITPQEMIGDIQTGFYVTSLMGQGVNGITGDYSRGASGFWIENGEFAFPVNEMTIAGNLKDMFMHITAANDLEFRYGTNAPTLRIDGMTIAGM